MDARVWQDVNLDRDIVVFMDYVKTVVKKFLSYHSSNAYLKDDLVGAGNLALVEYVRRCEQKGLEGSWGQLNVTINNALHTQVRECQTITPPKGQPYAHPEREEMVEPRFTPTVSPNFQDPLCQRVSDLLLQRCNATEIQHQLSLTRYEYLKVVRKIAKELET